LSLGFSLVRIGSHGRLMAVPIALYVVGVVLLFALNYPSLTGLSLRLA